MRIMDTLHSVRDSLIDTLLNYSKYYTDNGFGSDFGSEETTFR